MTYSPLMSKNNSKLVKTPLTPLQYIFWLGYAVCLNSLLSQLEKNLILLMIWIHQRWLYIKAKRFPPQYCMIKIFRMSIKEVGWIEIRALTKAVFLKMLLLLLRCEWVHVYLFCSKLDDVYKGNGMFFLVINIPAGIFLIGIPPGVQKILLLFFHRYFRSYFSFFDCCLCRPQSVSAQTRSIIFIRRTDDNGCQEDMDCVSMRLKWSYSLCSPHHDWDPLWRWEKNEEEEEERSRPRCCHDTGCRIIGRLIRFHHKALMHVSGLTGWNPLHILQKATCTQSGHH